MSLKNFVPLVLIFKLYKKANKIIETWKSLTSSIERANRLNKDIFEQWNGTR